MKRASFLALGAAVLCGAALAAPPPNDLAERVEQVAAAAARTSVAAPDRFEVQESRFGGADPLPTSVVSTDEPGLDGPDGNGSVRVRLRLLVDGAPRGEARATVRGTIRGPAVVARRAVPRGAPVPSDAVELADSDLTRLGEAPLRAVDQVLGQVASEALVPGRVLTPRLLHGEPVVRRGHLVDLRVVTGPLTVIVRGRSRADGAPGDTIVAENLSSKVLVEGRVDPDGSIVVSRGGGRSR